MHKQCEKIGDIDKNDMYSFLYRLMLKTPEIDKANDLPSKEIIDELLICLFKEVDCLSVEENHIVQARKNSQIYRASLIMTNKKEILQRQLSHEIGKSSDDKLLIYETDTLVTGRLNEDTFSVNDISVMVAGEHEYNALKGITSDSIEKNKMNCTKPKVMRLVDTTKAKEELA